MSTDIFTNINAIEAKTKANILAEALPYIRRFSGVTMVIKYGGNAMTDPQLKESFAKDVVLLKLVGIHPIIVHGGGPQINELLQKVGKENQFIQGMRVTDSETMDIVEMVLGGCVNKEITSLLNLHGGHAVGITGRDNHFIKAKKLFLTTSDNEKQDIGQVGEVEEIDTALIQEMVEHGYIPVVAPVGVGEHGEAFNINADVVAGKLAESLKAEKLIMLTNTIGVLDKNNQLLSRLTPSDINALIADGTLQNGMLPKINATLQAAMHGVHNTHIIDGRVPHALLLEIFTDKGVGTMILGQNEHAE